MPCFVLQSIASAVICTGHRKCVKSSDVYVPKILSLTSQSTVPAKLTRERNEIKAEPAKKERTKDGREEDTYRRETK